MWEVVQFHQCEVILPLWIALREKKYIYIDQVFRKPWNFGGMQNGVNFKNYDQMFDSHLRIKVMALWSFTIRKHNMNVTTFAWFAPNCNTGCLVALYVCIFWSPVVYQQSVQKCLENRKASCLTSESKRDCRDKTDMTKLIMFSRYSFESD